MDLRNTSPQMYLKAMQSHFRVVPVNRRCFAVCCYLFHLIRNHPRMETRLVLVFSYIFNYMDGESNT